MLRSPYLIVILACSFVLLLLAIPTLSQTLDLQASESNRLQSQPSSTAQGGNLDDRVSCHINRIQAKQVIIEDLVHDRLSLLEASQQFLELMQGDEYVLAPLRRSYPGDSDLESCARNVLDYIRLEVRSLDPAKAEEIQARLQSQFEEQFGQCGGKTSTSQE